MNAVATFVAALFAGMFVGAGLLGRLLDKYGRRLIFTFALVGYSISTLIMAFQSDPVWLNFWRFLASIGIGLEQVAIVTYASELVPSRYRGRAIAITQSMGFLGVPAVALVSWLLIPTTVLSVEGWRVVVIIGALGALLFWMIRRSLPESPIWLERHGRHAEAQQVLENMEKRAFGKAIPIAPETVAFGATSSTGYAAADAKAGWAVMVSPEVRWRIVMMIVVNICITIGYYGFASWVPTLLLAKGITTTKSLEYSMLMAFAAPVAPMLSLFVADKIERKYQLALACSGCALLGIAFSMQSVAGIVVLIGFLLTLNNGWMSSSYHSYQAELFPTRVRGQAVGFVYSWSRLSAIFSSYIISYLLARYGNFGVFAFITAAMAIIVITVLTFGPRTNSTVVS